MTKHGHKTYREFKEEWKNLDDETQSSEAYVATRERWLYKWRARIYEIAASSISWLIEEKGDRPCEEVLEDIKRTIDVANKRVTDKKW